MQKCSYLTITKRWWEIASQNTWKYYNVIRRTKTNARDWYFYPALTRRQTPFKTHTLTLFFSLPKNEKKTLRLHSFLIKAPTDLIRLQTKVNEENVLECFQFWFGNNVNVFINDVKLSQTEQDIYLLMKFITEMFLFKMMRVEL